MINKCGYLPYILNTHSYPSFSYKRKPSWCLHSLSSLTRKTTNMDDLLKIFSNVHLQAYMWIWFLLLTSEWLSTIGRYWDYLNSNRSCVIVRWMWIDALGRSWHNMRWTTSCGGNNNEVNNERAITVHSDRVRLNHRVMFAYTRDATKLWYSISQIHSFVSIGLPLLLPKGMPPQLLYCFLYHFSVSNGTSLSMLVMK